MASLTDEHELWASDRVGWYLKNHSFAMKFETLKGLDEEK